MKPRVSSAGGAVTALLCLGVACVGKPATSVPPADDPRDFYPMLAGNAWSYDVDTGEDMTTLAVTRVESFDGRVAVLGTAGATVRYDVLPEGIRVASSDAWLLRSPLEVGAKWPAPGGREAELVSKQTGAATPAGTFERCIEVLEVGGRLDLEVRTVYCPGIGPVSVASTLRSNTSDRSLTVFARLRGYTINPTEARSR